MIMMIIRSSFILTINNDIMIIDYLARPPDPKAALLAAKESAGPGV